MKKCINDIVFTRISEIAAAAGKELYVIGGFVRDCIMERESSALDIDIVVRGNGIDTATEVARGLGKGIKVIKYRNFGTAMFKYGGYTFEFVGARKESYSKNSRKPAVEEGTLRDDQLRRDFTINAMAISLNRVDFGELVDPFDGVGDIEKKIIRTPLDPDITFSDDPLRMMRAIRFATQLEFSVEPVTLASITRNAERIKIVSAERIIIELNKIMLSRQPSAGIKLMHETKLLFHFFPELHNLKGVDTIGTRGHKDNFDHTLQVLDKVSSESDDLYLRWAALLHDIAKPVTKRFVEGTGWTFHGHEFRGSKMVPGIFKRLKLPMNEKMRYVSKLVALHLRPISLSDENITDSAIRRLLFDAGDEIDDLMILCRADITSKNKKKVREHMKSFSIVSDKLKEIEGRDKLRNFQPPVSGDDIMATFNIGPGREIGILKSSIREAILDGIIPNEYDAAFRLMLEKGKEMGLTPGQDIMG